MLDPQQLGKHTIGDRIRALQSTVSRVVSNYLGKSTLCIFGRYSFFIS